MTDILQKSKTAFLMHKIRDFKLHQLQSQNIFEERNHSNGPQYDEKNKIIARSVVGKPEIIEKVKKRIEDSKLSNSPKMKNSVAFSKMKQSFSNLSNMKKSQTSNKIQLFPDSIHSNVLSRQESHNKSTLMAQIKESNPINIQEYLQEAKIRIKSNEYKDQEKVKQLPIFERNARTRQQRVITSFQDTEQSWEILNMTLQSKCVTKSSEKTTLLQRSSAFRLKQQILSEIPPQPKNWYQQLRGSPVLEKEPIRQSNPLLLHSKNLSQKQQDLDGSLRIRGESKLQKEFDNFKCPLITLGYVKDDTITCNTGKNILMKQCF